NEREHDELEPRETGCRRADDDVEVGPGFERRRGDLAHRVPLRIFVRGCARQSTSGEDAATQLIPGCARCSVRWAQVTGSSTNANNAHQLTQATSRVS